MAIRIAQLTDIHLTPTKGSRLYGVDTAVTLTRIVERIQQLSKAPELIIATGDLAEDGSAAAYGRLREILSVLQLPVYVLPGNHDHLSTMQSCLGNSGFHCIKSMKFGCWGFVFVNSQVEGRAHGRVNPVEMIELEKNLDALADHSILVALHHTPNTICPAGGCQLTNAQELTMLLNRYANVKAVIAGHTHTASELNAGAHIQFTTPSTFAQATHAPVGSEVDYDDFWSCHSMDDSLQGFRVLDLLPDGEIETKVHWLEYEAH